MHKRVEHMKRYFSIRFKIQWDSDVVNAMVKGKTLKS